MSPHSITAAIILAAGGSSRFGTPKQLLKVADKSLIRRTVDAAREANCSPIIVVTGAADTEINRELPGNSNIVIRNENWQRGIGSSIRHGIEHLANNFPNVEAVVLLVCDQPFVNSSTIKNLINLYNETRKPIAACRYANTFGVPALFGRALFSELLAIDDSSGAKPVIMRNRERVAELPFPEGEFDVDTAEQWDQLQSVTVPRKTSAA